jgi:hypothetical protein
MKRFVSLQFLNFRTVGRIPWMGDQLIARKLPTQTQNKCTQTSMPCVGFKSTIPVSELAKTVHAMATVIGRIMTTRRRKKLRTRLESIVFWFVTLCSLETDQYFEGIYRLHLQR